MAGGGRGDEPGGDGGGGWLAGATSSVWSFVRDGRGAYRQLPSRAQQAALLDAEDPGTSSELEQATAAPPGHGAHWRRACAGLGAAALASGALLAYMAWPRAAEDPEAPLRREQMLMTTGAPSSAPQPPASALPTYSCSAGLLNWERGWSEGKKQWCCSKYKVGCPASMASPTFDCSTGYENWSAGWSASKKAWCCARYSRGCPDREVHDCTTEIWRWQSVWSSGKKEWCCHRYRVGCAVGVPTSGGDYYDCGAGDPGSWPAAQQSWCCDDAGRGCQATTTSMRYDCSDASEAWPHDKKAWCCRSEGVGCLPAETPSPSAAPSGEDVKPAPTDKDLKPAPNEEDDNIEVEALPLKLCDASLVAQACRAWNGGEAADTVTAERIQKALSASHRSVVALWEALKFKNGAAVRCDNLCSGILELVHANGGTLPPFSDMGCYSAGHTVSCDVNLDPAHVTKKMVKNIGHVHPDHGPGLVEKQSPSADLKTAPSGSGQKTTLVARSLGSQQDSPLSRKSSSASAAANFPYTRWAMISRVAGFFRFFPAARAASSLSASAPASGSAAASAPPSIRASASASAARPVAEMNTGADAEIARLNVQAMAWVSEVVSQMELRATLGFREEWFGGSGAQTKEAVRLRLLRTMNFIERELETARYIHPADDVEFSSCGGSVLAYVWKWRTAGGGYEETEGPVCADEAQARRDRCGVDQEGNYFIYLCGWWDRFDEPTKIATLVHEAAHHAGPSDVSYSEAEMKGLLQDDQLNNAANYQNFAQDVALSAWGCADSESVTGVPWTCGGGNPCPCSALRGLCDHSGVRAQCPSTCGDCTAPSSTDAATTTAAPSTATTTATSTATTTMPSTTTAAVTTATTTTTAPSTTTTAATTATTTATTPTMPQAITTAAPSPATTAPSTGEPTWTVVHGECQQEDNCISSPNYPSSRYGNSQSCRISVQAGQGTISVADFDTEGFYDVLRVNGVRYHGSTGPEGVTPTSDITWSADHSVTRRGWKICLQARKAVDGECQQEGNCFSSPNYPSSYGNSQSCRISVQAGQGPISVKAFDTESWYDELTVNGVSYHGSAGPEGVTPTSDITWSSDFSVSRAGWKLCLGPSPGGPGSCEESSGRQRFQIGSTRYRGKCRAFATHGYCSHGDVREACPISCGLCTPPA